MQHKWAAELAGQSPKPYINPQSIWSLDWLLPQPSARQQQAVGSKSPAYSPAQNLSKNSWVSQSIWQQLWQNLKEPLLVLVLYVLSNLRVFDKVFMRYIPITPTDGSYLVASRIIDAIVPWRLHWWQAVFQAPLCGAQRCWQLALQCSCPLQGPTWAGHAHTSSPAPVTDTHMVANMCIA